MKSATHKYQVGQPASILPARGRTTQPGGHCRILAILPYENYPPQYRVQLTDERHQRIVAETDLQMV